MQSINWHSVIFLLFSLLACGFALAVVFTSNVVRMAFYLVLSLGATAGLFFLAGADFVGAMQILIYVGGTLVLLVFGVMLTAQGPFISMKTASGEWILTALVGGSLLAVLLPTAYKIADWNKGVVGSRESEVGSREVKTSEPAGVSPRTAEAGDQLPQAQPTATPIGLGLLGARVDQLNEPKGTSRGVLSGYLLPFEIVSVHLLVVLIGAAYLARAKKRVRPRGMATVDI
jgi:NADH-quinone oxidoreductase subunit J